MAGLASIGKAIKFALSATVGIPVALAASVVVGTAAVTLRAMDKCWSEIYKKAFGSQEVPNAFLKAAADGAFAAFSGIWTWFGISAYKDSAVAIDNRLNKVGTYLGFENHDKFYAESWKDHLNPSRAEEETLKMIEKGEKTKAEKEAAKQAIKDEEFAKKFERKYSVAGPKESITEPEASTVGPKGPTTEHKAAALSPDEIKIGFSK